MFRDKEAEESYKEGTELMRIIHGAESIEFADACYGLANL